MQTNSVVINYCVCKETGMCPQPMTMDEFDVEFPYELTQ
jgi:hypothetical protein